MHTTKMYDSAYSSIIHSAKVLNLGYAACDML